MILQALYKYYNVAPNMPPYGMKYQAIPFIIVIGEDGKFVRLEDTRNDEEKTGRRFLLPKAKPRSGKNSFEVAQVLWDFGQYVIGLPLDEDNFRPPHFSSFLEQIDDLIGYCPGDVGLNAVREFYNTNQLASLFEDPTYQSIKGEEDKWKFSFRLSSEQDQSILVANSAFLDIGTYLLSEDQKENRTTGVCAITGNTSHLCRLHETIDIRDGGTNPRLIAFQKSSGFDSYGKQQGENAPISIEASDAIHSALNTLIRYGEDTNYYLSGITYLFWSTPADSQLSKDYREGTFGLGAVEEGISAEEYRNRSKKLLQSLKAVAYAKGATLNTSGEEGSFYILGLAPNNARISVVLWQEGTISEIIGNTIRHLQDMNIIDFDGFLDVNDPPLRSIPGIISSISTTAKSDKWSKLMVKNIIRSVVCNLPYPREMQLACLDRIRATRGITALRAAILKAYLNRSKTNKYHITMALDRTNTESAYLLGRLFALLEGMQSAALNNLNATIRDRYYGAASTAPSSAFGQLMKLYGAHLSKLRKEKPGLANYYDKMVEDIFVHLSAERIPAHFNADEQSLFAIGYYHERVDLYKNKTKEQENE